MLHILPTLTHILYDLSLGIEPLDLSIGSTNIVIIQHVLIADGDLYSSGVETGVAVVLRQGQ